MSLAANLVSYT